MSIYGHHAGGNSGEQVKQEELELWGEWDDVDLVGIQVREPLQ